MPGYTDKPRKILEFNDLKVWTEITVIKESGTIFSSHHTMKEYRDLLPRLNRGCGQQMLSMFPYETIEHREDPGNSLMPGFG